MLLEALHMLPGIYCFSKEKVHLQPNASFAQSNQKNVRHINIEVHKKKHMAITHSFILLLRYYLYDFLILIVVIVGTVVVWEEAGYHF